MREGAAADHLLARRATDGELRVARHPAGHAHDAAEERLPPVVPSTTVIRSPLRSRIPADAGRPSTRNLPGTAPGRSTFPFTSRTSPACRCRPNRAAAPASVVRSATCADLPASVTGNDARSPPPRTRRASSVTMTAAASTIAPARLILRNKTTPLEFRHRGDDSS
jgi:hypothetical protein